ncbi:N-acetylmuramic acid 6-phosphate etherase [Purpureocillium takamizusanense]|uniref:N-acetyl-D-glucosamine kinase n=1 Tax=Purpureocillium takamizusanense TaxID=2060973 RepID=A0A9Q8VFH1_9HYPO|nr:N-acetylmuramic acid 6-phosphate etherase [Purpureocillium takamizusanense]UNI25040.1 N-acetylmuramic acid 6-phosphate etherase [Purpureocillium takamizusanense]
MAPSSPPDNPHQQQQQQQEHDDALGSLDTEALSPVARTMDSMDTLGLCTSFNHEEARVSRAVAERLPAIAALVDDLVPRLRAGGRLVYVGAGNSGRVAHMDCAELPVTFSVDGRSQFLAVVAGGTAAVLGAVEGAEDLVDDGAARMRDLDLTPRDTVIGISASGRTPFVMGALGVAVRRGALTAAITNNTNNNTNNNTGASRMQDDDEDMSVAHPIAVPVGAEFVTGSTRLKAGSCAKQVLNMISTCAMVKLGKTYRGLMVDVRANNNEKLRARGRRIVRQVLREGKPSTRTTTLQHVRRNDNPGAVAAEEEDADDEDDRAIDALIERCGGSVKLACAVGLSGLHPDAAKERLASVDGHLEAFVNGLEASESPRSPQRPTTTNTPHGQGEEERERERQRQREYFLCIDGGGTKCAVSIATRGEGIVAQATAGACNLNSTSLDDAVEQIRRATAAAAASLHGPDERSGQVPWRPSFTRVWAGIAGLHHASHHAGALASRLEHLLGVSTERGSLRLTCDTSLLSSCLLAAADDDDEELAEGCCVALIAGTGAVATAFRRSADTGGEVVQVGRTGGWGHLVGDQGSAFYIGQQALRIVLTSLEARQSDDDDTHHSLNRPLEAAVVKHLGCGNDPKDVLSSILSSVPEGGAQQPLPKQRIGRLALVVTQLGFADVDPDPQARAILDDAAACLARLVRPLASERLCDPPKGILALSGALMNVKPYRDLVLDKCAAMGVRFGRIVVVTDASAYGAEFLAKMRHTSLDGDR